MKVQIKVNYEECTLVACIEGASEEQTKAIFRDAWQNAEIGPMEWEESKDYFEKYVNNGKVKGMDHICCDSHTAFCVGNCISWCGYDEAEYVTRAFHDAIVVACKQRTIEIM